MLDQEFFQRDPVTCARELIGKELRWNGCSGIVVETEAYAEHGDEACHTFFRPSAREFVNSHEAGASYVYLNYGMYWLSNVLVRHGRENGFVLLRALEPLSGIPVMQERRRKEKLKELCSGPGKLSMALGITGSDHGSSFVKAPERCFVDVGNRPEIVADPRIGITKDADRPWRFTMRDSRFVSRAPVLSG